MRSDNPGGAELDRGNFPLGEKLINPRPATADCGCPLVYFPTKFLPATMSCRCRSTTLRTVPWF